MAEKQFADGIRFNTPSEKAPEFVKGTISIQIEKFIPWAQAHADERGWINLDVKESKGGKIYCEVSSWKPNKKAETNDEPAF